MPLVTSSLAPTMATFWPAVPDCLTSALALARSGALHLPLPGFFV